MIYFRYTIIILSISIFGSSCTNHYYYFPHSTHHTQISEKDEITASAAVGKIGANDLLNSSSKGKQCQLQAAYSPIKHLAVSTSVGFSLSNNTKETYTNGYDVDLAIGTYFFTGQSKKDSDKRKGNPESTSIYEEGILFDAYLSYGRGRVVNDYGLGQNDFFAYNRYSMQLGIYYRARPSIGRLNTSFSMGLIVRPAILEFSDGMITGSLTHRSNGFLRLLNQGNRFRINEYTLTGQIGLGPVRLFLNTNCIASQSRQFDSYIDNEAFQAGVLFEVDRLFDFKKERKLLPKKL